MKIIQKLSNRMRSKDGEELAVKILVGMSRNDFERNKEAFEQHLRSKVTFTFKDNLIVDVVNRKGETYPYK